MIDKAISAAELLSLVEDGAQIKTERRPMIIEQFGELIEAFRSMIAAQELRATADLKRSQTQLEVLAVLQSQIKQQGGVNRSPPVDLKPLETMLATLGEFVHHEPADYDFNILRSGPGLSPAVKIEARVVKPTLN